MTEFFGYVRENGTVGVRNYVLLLSATVYANRLCERVADVVHNAVPITHPLGRCQVQPDLRMTRRFLAGTARNPNIGAVVIVEHFREEGMTADDLAHDIASTGKPVAVVNMRGEGGLIHATEQATRYAADYARMLSDMRRESAPLSKLLFGTECGTSDTTSGLAGNPATGVCMEKIIAEGGRGILAECTEWMGCENWLTSRARTPEIAEQIVAGVKHMENRALASGEDIRGSQPTGDNMVGGLTTIEEKSMGAVKKGGNAEVVGYLDIAEEPADDAGLYVMYGPGHGAESISSMAAAGCQVLVFSTGGGHASSHPIMPTIKVTGNAQSYGLMKDTVDLDVSGILRGEMSIDDGGQVIFDEVVAVANGRITKSEALCDDNSFAIHRIGVSI
jgi:altronate dehydratase large subunit